MQSGSFFFGLWGFWLQSALIFSEEVSCCKWKVSIGFIYPIFFSFFLHISCYFSLRFCLVFNPSTFSLVPLFCLCLSFPSSLCSFLSFSFFLSHFYSAAVSLSLSCSRFLPLLHLVFSSSAACCRETNRTVNLHCNTEFAITFYTATASRYH